jgi:uncharacterized NAD-dependent epimerase/dehydratase family protein
VTDQCYHHCNNIQTLEVVLNAIPAPYLIFLGDAPHAKTAQGVRDWRPELCLGQHRYPASQLDLGLPEMTIEQAIAAGARTLLLGAAPAGGALPHHWLASLEQALDAGLDIANGLHTRLNAIEPLRSRADRLGRRLYDVRHPDRDFQIGDFAPRTGWRVLTVGTDCAVGKMYTALAVEREMRRRGWDADFRATGQTGILISGSGVSVDAVISDFVSAASVSLSPPAPNDHWDIIEGQGSLFHPAYAGVTLGLVHGSQPDAMILCADPTRETIGEFVHYPQPSLDVCIDAYERAARLTNASAKVIGISLNTSCMAEKEAQILLDRTADASGLPCVDPVRTGVVRLVDELAAISPAVR